ncbi:hypothetical protein [Phenylobacterium soli]|uniref:Uncharacterized protein n=1 Tax=Phenylobacterium soli TaxID=2170551 RepID=A0A328AAC6_9CAUL|nr:hypothetical protein [Phenylobacterium soli]RAK51136.1 hypothetical protein DJ017_19425 [Phenylobacterium soli]
MNPALDEMRMRMLGRFAEMAVVLAEDLQCAALAAEDTDEKVRLAEAFHRVGRGLRQSLALDAKLEADRHRDGREAELHLAKVGDLRRERRKAEIKGVVEALVWTEKERLDVDPDDAVEALDAILDAEAQAAGFMDTDPQVFIARLCKALKLELISLEGHGPPCAGQPDAPSDLRPAASALSPTPTHPGPRDKPADDGWAGEFDSSA